MSKQTPPVPNASAICPCPTMILVGRPGTGSLPKPIAPPDHLHFILGRNNTHLVHIVFSISCNCHLTLQTPITTAADAVHIFFHCFSEKVRLDVSSKSSAHMTNQALFSSKDKSKQIKMSSAAIFVWHFKG